MNRARLAVPIAMLLASIASAVAAERHTGRVTHVVDGHSLEVLVKAQRFQVRLAGIDAPQARPFGLRSRQSLVQLCSGEMATVEATAVSRKGALVGHVACGATDAGAEQIRRGMARISDRDDAGSQLRALEDEARAAHRGVWSIQTR